MSNAAPSHTTPADPLRSITVDNIDDIAMGAAIFGAGGGGDPYLGSLLAKQAIAEHGEVALVSPADVPDDAMAIPVALMGAPTVIVEKIPSGAEFSTAVRAVSEVLPRPITHIACLEAGGLNSMTPIITAAMAGLPLIDGDGMGRAFPELQMVLFTLDGLSSSPMAMADDKGNTVVLDTITNEWSERLARSATVDMGASAAIALYPLTGANCQTGLVPHTLSLAAQLGALVRTTRAAHGNVASAVATYMGGRVLFSGRVTDVERRTEGGFAKGQAVLAGIGDFEGQTAGLAFQNEHLVATVNGNVSASVPDIICVLQAETGEPITTEAMAYGFRISIIAFGCHERWRTPEGLKLVGPQYFGYSHTYVPIDA